MLRSNFGFDCLSKI